MIYQLVSAVEKPTSQYALMRSPYWMIQQRILSHKVSIRMARKKNKWDGSQRTYPNEIHTKTALRAFVTTIPYVLIIGKTAAIPTAMRADRRPLQGMAFRLRRTILGHATHPFAARLSALLECMTSTRYAAHGPKAISTYTVSRY